MKKTVKKYKDGGKPKEVRTGRTYFKENSKEPLEKKDIKKTYVAKKNGKVVSREVTRYPRKGDMYTNLNTTSMDTTGYAAGDKKTFTVKQTNRSLYGKPSGNSWEIARGRVEGTIKDMKNGTKPTKMKKGGKLHLGFKEAQAKIAKKQGVSMEAAGAILASSARKASPAAVKKNPSLLNVKRGKTKKYQDGGTTTKTKVVGNFGTPSDSTYMIKHTGKNGVTTKYLDNKQLKHKGSKGTTLKSSNYDKSVTVLEHRGKLGYTAVRKDKKYGDKSVYYQSNTPGKKSFSKVSKLRKGGKKR